ncbi:MAG: hypothetical protein IJQ56_11700, partial [Synergistaceae bacterium]|nr:hypothetical protein [Synergistaceae bacterium]
MIKQLAVFLHWFAGFALILLEIWEIIKNWGNGCFRGLYFIPHYPEIGYKKLRLAEFTLNVGPILSQYFRNCVINLVKTSITSKKYILSLFMIYTPPVLFTMALYQVWYNLLHEG